MKYRADGQKKLKIVFGINKNGVPLHREKLVYYV